MNPNIDAIFLDVGNTLRIVIKNPEFQQKALEQLYELVGAREPMEKFYAGMEERWKTYRKRAKTMLVEDCERDLWCKWLLPDYPAEKIAPLAGRLTRLWRDRDGIRVPRHDVKDTVIELDRRGYKLGIIANTITETEIPDWMTTDGVTDYFKTVILSSKVGLRKPDPEIYWLAAREIGVEPAKCAYVGDNPVRDVEGTQAAGYGMMILIEEPDTIAKENAEDVVVKPDYTITEIGQLLDIFPPREQHD